MNQPNIMKRLRPLSPQVRRFLYAVLILFTLLLLCYFLCLTLGSIALFQAFLCKMSFFLGGRALSFALFKLGCSGGLAWAFAFVCKAFLTAEATPFVLYMVPSGASTYPTQEAPSVPDLTQGLHTGSADPGSIIYRAPSPGGPVEILEIPESPSNPSPVPPLPAPSVNQEEIFQELDGEGQQPMEVDPSTPDSDLFDLDKEGDTITFYEDSICDLVHELREEEKRPLADEPHRITRAIDRVREKLSDPNKQEGENLIIIDKEIRENRLMSRAYLYFNFYLDIEVKDEISGVTEDELIKAHDEGS